MQVDDKLYRSFLEELHALELFRTSYTGTHAAGPLEQEDPDVRRLMEAMAFFSARTREAGERNILATRRRLFQRCFSYLLEPLPAMATLDARVTGTFTSPTSLPRGTEVSLSHDGQQIAVFRTLYDLRLMPIELTGLSMLLRPKGGYRLLLYFQTPFPRNDEVESLPIRISHFDNHAASARLIYRLEKHLEKAFVVFDDLVDEETNGKAIPISFGVPENPAEPSREEGTSHPVQRVRERFHYPEAEFYMNVAIPPAPRNWSRFVLALDLDDGWPRKLKLNAEAFRLFTVPMTNRLPGAAQPIICDGTKERYLLVPADSNLNLSLHSVNGVYRVGPEGTSPLPSSILSGEEGAWELERGESPAGTEQTWLRLKLPSAFEEPVTVTVDADWIQPWFSDVLDEQIDLRPRDRVVEGVKWGLLGEVRPHADNSLRHDREGMLHLLSLQSLTALKKDELVSLLGALGLPRPNPFRGLSELLKHIDVTEAPQTRNGMTGVKLVYKLSFYPFDSSRWPVVERFLHILAALLKAWTPNGAVSVEAWLAEADNPVCFE